MNLKLGMTKINQADLITNSKNEQFLSNAYTGILQVGIAGKGK